MISPPQKNQLSILLVDGLSLSLSLFTEAVFMCLICQLILVTIEEELFLFPDI